VVMTMHRLTAGAGYQYLLKHTASGDCDRTGGADLTAYYTASGNPPGRWYGRGLRGFAEGAGIAAGSLVTEPQMANLFGAGKDPTTGRALGRPYPVHTPAKDRIAAQVAKLPDGMDETARAAAIAAITDVELAKPAPSAVAGFDLTFTPAKSVSTLWAVSDAATQAVVLAAHRVAVGQALVFFEDTALFTRTGAAGCLQHKVTGVSAAGFEHWDSRAGDPNLHTHLVLANKVQGPGGAWLTVDSRALHRAVVMVSEVYDDLLADELARRLPVAFGWRHRGPRRSPGFELVGVDDALMTEFSTRTTQIDEAMTGTVANFYAAHGRGPNRIEVVKLRQQVTRATRPDKHVTPLGDLMTAWRARATHRTGKSPAELTAAVLRASQMTPLHAGAIPGPVIAGLAEQTVTQVMTRRSTWTRWNVMAEAARTTRALRMATPADRTALLNRVTDAVLASCASLQAPDPLIVGPTYQRPDGTSQFTRVDEPRYTHHRVLDAEERLLAAATTPTGAPTAPEWIAAAVTSRPVHRTDGRTVTLAGDQADAVAQVAASTARVDVLVGPAGTGKTTTLAALKAVWERTYGRGAVVGLAPSATAAAELAQALGIGCENTAKWLYESAGPGADRRAAMLAHLHAERPALLGLDSRARLRTLDTAINTLTAQGNQYRLRPDQLLIVDEASLAGTFTLDALTAQAATAGAKVLLVGDHKQLSAVEAGGGFHLLAERAHPALLTSLWRFSQPWEAAATRRLRAGDTGVIEVYAEHDRISAGAAEVMCEDAYTAWQTDTEHGIPAILLAPDAHTVEVLNTRAHNDRVADGIVTSAAHTTPGGTPIGVGDRVLTRENNRRLRTPAGFVRNGDLWDVTAIAPDGALTVTPIARPGSVLPAASGEVTLPAVYVAEHVDLGYATTTHRAQGITVDHTHVLAAPGMVRENLYVAMTRGRHDNHVYIAVDEVDPTCDYLPDGRHVPGGYDALAAILTTTGTELSATETITASQDQVASLRRLEPIRQTLIADAAAHHWDALFAGLGLTEAQCEQITTSPAHGPLITALERGRTLGRPMPQILTGLITDRPLDGVEPAGDLAAGLHHRVNDWLRTQVEDPTTIRLTPDTADATGEVAGLLVQVDQLIAERVDALTDHAITTGPDWLTALGPAPTDSAARSAWRAQIAAHLAREDYTGPATADATRVARPAAPVPETERSLNR
jgi:conjugative relaxase-like TrwC/TraI family protein